MQTRANERDLVTVGYERGGFVGRTPFDLAASMARAIRNETPTIARTHYVGIHVQQQDEHYWIMDDNGNEQYCGTERPSLAQIDAYRDSAINH